jgi:hypothetical protein
MSLLLAHLTAAAIAFPPMGFRNALIDFSLCVLFAYLADTLYRPPAAYRWLLFVLCAVLSLLFFIAWIVDLGARV